MIRKEKLKKIVLDNKHYDIDIYRLIESGALDFIISNLKNNTIIENNYDKENINYNQHIIMLLHNFVHFFKSNFKDLCPFFEFILENIFRDNADIFINYLNEDKSVNNEKNFKYYELWNYKLSIVNFIKNTHFSSVKKLFDDNNISVKEINKYSDEEVKNIFDLLKNVISSSTIDIALPFDNVYKYIDNPNITEEIKERILIRFNELFEELITNNL